MYIYKLITGLLYYYLYYYNDIFYLYILFFILLLIYILLIYIIYCAHFLNFKFCRLVTLLKIQNLPIFSRFKRLLTR